MGKRKFFGFLNMFSFEDLKFFSRRVKNFLFGLFKLVYGFLFFLVCRMMLMGFSLFLFILKWEKVFCKRDDLFILRIIFFLICCWCKFVIIVLNVWSWVFDIGKNIWINDILDVVVFNFKYDLFKEYIYNLYLCLYGFSN